MGGVIKNNLKKHDHSGDDGPAGSGKVYVRGFDFGTTDEQFEGHMSQAGPIHQVKWVTKDRHGSVQEEGISGKGMFHAGQNNDRWEFALHRCRTKRVGGFEKEGHLMT